MKNIIETASEKPDFSTLVTAIKSAGLAETLAGPGRFTIFAPTNAAFAKIPEDTLKAVLADKPKLTALLKYHAVAGTFMAADIAKMADATTLEGSKLKIDTKNGVHINDAKVVTPDIECANGVIHVIDTVLMP